MQFNQAQIIIAAVCFIGVLNAAVAGNIIYILLIRRLREKGVNERSTSYFFGNTLKFLRVRRLYRENFPDGSLLTVLNILGATMLFFGIALIITVQWGR